MNAKLTPQQEWLWVVGGAAVVAVLYTQAPQYGRPALWLVALVIFLALMNKGVICFTPGCKGAQVLPGLSVPQGGQAYGA